jgi:hypothetical protein
VPSLSLIDFVTYMPQTTDFSQGRSPNGGTSFRNFATPTPSAANLTVASSAAVDDFFAEVGRRAPESTTNSAIRTPGRGRPNPRTAAVPVCDDGGLLLATLADQSSGTAARLGATTTQREHVEQALDQIGVWLQQLSLGRDLNSSRV